jgi:hypothetical protein
MLWVGFEPTISASERAKTIHALDCSATVTGSQHFTVREVPLPCSRKFFIGTYPKPIQSDLHFHKTFLSGLFSLLSFHLYIGIQNSLSWRLFIYILVRTYFASTCVLHIQFPSQATLMMLIIFGEELKYEGFNCVVFLQLPLRFSYILVKRNTWDGSWSRETQSRLQKLLSNSDSLAATVWQGNSELWVVGEGVRCGCGREGGGDQMERWLFRVLISESDCYPLS